jgi:hypothetical protein
MGEVAFFIYIYRRNENMEGIESQDIQLVPVNEEKACMILV